MSSNSNSIPDFEIDPYSLYKSNASYDSSDNSNGEQLLENVYEPSSTGTTTTQVLPSPKNAGFSTLYKIAVGVLLLCIASMTILSWLQFGEVSTTTSQTLKNEITANFVIGLIALVLGIILLISSATEVSGYVTNQYQNVKQKLKKY